MQRDEAWSLLNEYVKNAALVRHCLAVEASMRYYARLYGADEALWGLTGLLHDFDYERFPEPPAHTREGAKILRERGVDEEIVGAILSHAEWNLDEFPRDRPLRRTLFAVDELSGFIVACALVRPERLIGMKASSVRKKMKQASFAAAVSREDIVAGAELLGIELSDHVNNCIMALTERAETLELTQQ
ncbi:MAG TPA: HDIG domain-containing protein [Phycisphaerae bacterium]|nr:HDIG domain-containing protein [Phycisphaerae bacterium]